jgi:hypothetical protein
MPSSLDYSGLIRLVTGNFKDGTDPLMLLRSRSAHCAAVFCSQEVKFFVDVVHLIDNIYISIEKETVRIFVMFLLLIMEEPIPFLHM